MLQGLDRHYLLCETPALGRHVPMAQMKAKWIEMFIPYASASVREEEHSFHHRSMHKSLSAGISEGPCLHVRSRNIRPTTLE
jgi:hypothetical protein